MLFVEFVGMELLSARIIAARECAVWLCRIMEQVRGVRSSDFVRRPLSRVTWTGHSMERASPSAIPEERGCLPLSTSASRAGCPRGAAALAFANSRRATAARGIDNRVS